MRYIVLLLMGVLIISCAGSSETSSTKLKIISHLNRETQELRNSCAQIENRETRDYTFSWNPYLRMQEGYRISRVGQTYDAFLKIVTKSSTPNQNNTYEYSKLSAALMGKWRSCLEKVNNSMIHKGSKLRVHLVNYSDKRDMPYAVIGNQKSELGASDQLWLMNSSCAQILKKTFNLLGLADEQKEQRHQCRATSIKESVMYDTEEALYKIKRTGYDYITYRCACDSHHNRFCSQLLSKGYQAWGKNGQLQCPKGTYLIKKFALKKDLWDWAQTRKTQVLSYYKRPFGELGIDLLCQAYGAIADRYSHCEKVKNPSLIHPAHFRAILNPHCRDKNPQYTTCSSFAYKSRSCGENKKKYAFCFEGRGEWLK